MKYRPIFLLILLFVFQQSFSQTDRKSEKIKAKLEGLWLFEKGGAFKVEYKDGIKHVINSKTDKFFLDSLYFKGGKKVGFYLQPKGDRPAGWFEFYFDVKQKGEILKILDLDLKPEDDIKPVEFSREIKLMNKNKLMINFPIATSIDYATKDTIRAEKMDWPIYFKRYRE